MTEGPRPSRKVVTVREMSGLGGPSSKSTEHNCLPVRATIVSSGWRGTGLIGLTSNRAALAVLTYGYGRISYTNTDGRYIHGRLVVMKLTAEDI